METVRIPCAEESTQMAREREREERTASGVPDVPYAQQRAHNARLEREYEKKAKKRRRKMRECVDRLSLSLSLSLFLSI